MWFWRLPDGLLQKLIHVLHRLDPDNARWKAQNRKPLELRLAAALQTPDPSRRETEVDEAEAALAKLDRDFSNANKPDYARKLYLIDKCIFGVDIQPIAVQIAKLRFFISLVVSQKIDRTEDNANVTALPNLETKLVAANSLIPIERPRIDDLFRNKAIEQKEAELRGMNARYFSARTAKTKRARREDIARLRDELAELLKADRGLPAQDAKQMAAWDPFDQNSSAGFFDPEWMFQLAPPANSFTGSYRAGAFDLVIGNPPYVRQEAIKDQKPALEKHYGGKDRQGNPIGAYAGTADLFIYFIQRGIELFVARRGLCLHHLEQMVPRQVRPKPTGLAEPERRNPPRRRFRRCRGVRRGGLSHHSGCHAAGGACASPQCQRHPARHELAAGTGARRNPELPRDGRGDRI